MNTTLTSADLDPRRQAMLLYFQGYRVARIAEMLGEKVATVHSWKKRDKWGDYGPLDQMQLTTAARYCQLIMKEHKEGKDFKEIDLLARQSERHARIGKFNNGGNEADLNPNVANRNKGPRRQPEKNVFTDEQIEKLEEIFHSSMFNYQRHWWEAGKTNRIRNLLKSRQIGATFYFAREALIDALLTGRNQIFLSASKAQAHVFKQYIIDFAKEVEVELKGDPMVLPNGATLYFLGTNARTAEMCKLTENSSRDSQIAFANELSMICDKAGINVWELIELANKHPRVNILQPGCGVGGHCIAVDPWFIVSDYPEQAQLIKRARETNDYKADWCANKVLETCQKFVEQNEREPVVACMGLAFKPNIDDLREYPAKYIASRIISESRADVLIIEPNISTHKSFHLTDYREAYEKADIIVWLVRHDVFLALPREEGKIELDFCGVRR